MKIKITETFDMVPPGEKRTEKDEIKFRAGQVRTDLADDVAKLIIAKGLGVEIKDAVAPAATTTDEPKEPAKVAKKGSAT